MHISCANYNCLNSITVMTALVLQLSERHNKLSFQFLVTPAILIETEKKFSSRKNEYTRFFVFMIYIYIISAIKVLGK